MVDRAPQRRQGLIRASALKGRVSGLPGPAWFTWIGPGVPTPCPGAQAQWFRPAQQPGRPPGRGSDPLGEGIFQCQTRQEPLPEPLRLRPCLSEH
jgi:hypothetical protein